MTINRVLNLRCAGCGAPVSTEQKHCAYCGREIIISSYGTIESLTPLELNKSLTAYRQALTENGDNSNLNFSLAMCYLRLKLYDNAISFFDKAINFDPFIADYYFYRACATLKGKTPFLLPRKEIDLTEQYILSAITTEQKPIYYYLYAYVRYEYFFRKCFNVRPKYNELFQESLNLGLSEKDINTFYAIIGQKRPEKL